MCWPSARVPADRGPCPHLRIVPPRRDRHQAADERPRRVRLRRLVVLRPRSLRAGRAAAVQPARRPAAPGSRHLGRPRRLSCRDGHSGYSTAPLSSRPPHIICQNSPAPLPLEPATPGQERVLCRYTRGAHEAQSAGREVGCVLKDTVAAQPQRRKEGPFARCARARSPRYARICHDVL